MSTDSLTATGSSLDDEVARFWAAEHDAVQDVFPLMHRLLETSPVHRHGDLVFVTRYDDVKKVLTDSKHFSGEFMSDEAGRTQRLAAELDDEHRDMFAHLVRVERSFTSHSNGKEHERRRRALHLLFTPRRIAEFEEATQSYVDEVLDQFEPGSTVDLAPALTTLPSWVIAYLLGVPRDDCGRLASWVVPIANNLHSTRLLDDAYASAEHFQEYLTEMIEGRRPGHRETELFATIRDAAEGFQPERLLAIFLEMNLGGNESVRGLLQGGVTTMMQHRDQWERLKGEPDLLPNAIEEIFRYVSPGLWTTRIPFEPVELRGVEITPGDSVICMVGASNRDPEEFPDPDTFDIARPNARQHLALGHGTHYCLGQALARLQLSVLLRSLMQRFPDMHLTDAPIERSGSAQNPKIERIEVRLG